VSLPRFFNRIADATLPVLGTIDRAALEQQLHDVAVALQAVPAVTDRPEQAEGFLLAANLAARLYPRLTLLGPSSLTERAATLVLSVNPDCDLLDAPAANAVQLVWGAQVSDGSGVGVSAAGWNVAVDGRQPDRLGPASPPAALAAAAVGIGELFRIVFAPHLGDRGRIGPVASSWNVLTETAWSDEAPIPELGLPVGRVHLAGAGAIGQAATMTLLASAVQGTLVPVDQEPLELSNLQRYVLAYDADVGQAKTALIQRAASDTLLEVEPVTGRWGTKASSTDARVVLTALDTPEDRIAVQAALPERIYNAYTQPADLGWSRHERFGKLPCLACLYWPNRPRPHRHEQIGAALGQHPLRVLLYLLSPQLLVGQPLPPALVANRPDLPPEASRWAEVPLLQDLAAARSLADADIAAWSNASIETLYREGVCGGALLAITTADTAVIVPLAHQSTLAGIMLAVQLIAASSDLLHRYRPATIEGRYDVLRAPSSPHSSPRRPTPGCLCSDPDFVRRYRQRWA